MKLYIHASTVIGLLGGAKRTNKNGYCRNAYSQRVAEYETADRNLMKVIIGEPKNYEKNAIIKSIENVACL
jgi:hypothetical protein